MEDFKEKAIRQIIDSTIKSFADGFEGRHLGEVGNPNGTINSKKNNCFMQVLGNDFIFYSALVRSFDSAFGKVLENIGNAIAKLNYVTKSKIESYILPEQTSHIANLTEKYRVHAYKPEISHYESFYILPPKNIDSFKTEHVCDNWFYDKKTKTHYLIELKSGGDLDNKKAEIEKVALLKEYFMLKNSISKDEKIVLKFATAYNKFGEGNYWRQGSVEMHFAREELLIGKDYWDFVCNDPNGFNIVFDQYKKSAIHLIEALDEIKKTYGM